MSSNQLNYAWAATAALALGFGFSFWASSVENGRLRRAHDTAGIELVATQEKLDRVVKELRIAEAAQTIAESSERVVRDKLAQETKTRQNAEAAFSLVASKISDMKSAAAALVVAEAQARALTKTVLADAGLAEDVRPSLAAPEIRTETAKTAEAQKEPPIGTESPLQAVSQNQGAAPVEAAVTPAVQDSSAVEPAATEKQAVAPVEAAAVPAAQESSAAEPAATEKQAAAPVEAAAIPAEQESRAVEPAATEKQAAAEAAVMPVVQESPAVEPAATGKQAAAPVEAAATPAVQESRAVEPAATEKQDASRVDTAAIPSTSESSPIEPAQPQTVR